MNKKEIRKLFNIYKKKYKLKTKLKFNVLGEKENGEFTPFNNQITINLLSIEKIYEELKIDPSKFVMSRGIRISVADFEKYVTLHEIKHAIDHKNNKVDFNRYMEDEPYKIKIEKRAVRFGIRESRRV